MVSMVDLLRRNDDGSPVITLNDVCNLNEILACRHENEMRADEAARRKASKK